jgi:putative transcriptional regulator
MSVTELHGHLLIAMPTLADPNFWRTVILLGSHSPEDGAFGLIVNRPSEIALKTVLPQLGITETPSRAPAVLAGGPVQPEQGFVLVEGISSIPSEHDINDPRFTISGRSELLEALAMGDLKRRFHLCLGYAGWAPGQLETEIEQNSWLVAPATDTLVFETPLEDRWHQALASIGVDPGALVDLGAGEPS